MPTQLISDDELVALTAARGGAWPLGLPTVDGDALASAARRGVRSLTLRGLVQHRPPGWDELSSAISAALESGVEYVAYRADHDDPRTSVGPVLAIFAAAPGGRAVDVVSAAGVHSIEQLDDDSADLLLAEWISATQAANGTIEPVGRAVLVVVGPSNGDHRKAWVFGAGEVQFGTMRGEGGSAVFDIVGSSPAAPSIRVLRAG